MVALTTLFPVFFMLTLGYVSRRRQWITPEQKAGANAIIFNVLFPILIFNLMCSATIEIQHMKIVGYVLFYLWSWESYVLLLLERNTHTLPLIYLL